MEKLAAHYAKNKDIELISISLDEEQAKWEKKLAEDKPEWKQYICPDAFDSALCKNYDIYGIPRFLFFDKEGKVISSALCKNYDIYGIPRFLFFDKEGKVISLNAPRPSYESIIEYIDKHIVE